jgi:hypothetical protein
VTIGPSLGIGLLVVLVAVQDDDAPKPGLDQPVPVAIAIGLVVALVAAVLFALWIRRAPRDLALRVGPDRLAFTQGETERWSIPWAAVAAAGIVHSTLPGYRREAAPSYLRLELADGTAPHDPSLHLHEGAWWFPLVGSNTAGRLHRDLVRRIPGRTRPMVTEARVPTHLASPGRSRRL